MRLILAVWWSLVCFWLLTSYLDAQSGSGQATPSLVRNWPKEMTGYGETQEEARHEAVEHLAKILALRLAEQDPPLVAWKPTADFAEKWLIDPAGIPGPELIVPNLGPRRTWVFPVKTFDWKWAVQLDQAEVRRLRADHRRLVAFEVYGVVLAGVGVAWAYLSLRGRRQRS